MGVRWLADGCVGVLRTEPVAAGMRVYCLQQCKSFVEMCIVPQCIASVRMWAGVFNLGLPSLLFAIVTLPPRSTAPTVAGCCLVGCNVVS